MNPSPEHRTVEDIPLLPSILGCIKFTLTRVGFCCIAVGLVPFIKPFLN